MRRHYNEFYYAPSKLIVFIFCLPFLAWMITVVQWHFEYTINCSGHLKRAADANTVALAKQELGTALSYIERNRMTTGWTHILIPTQNKDVKFWHTNLKESFSELEKCEAECKTQFERTNVLMKLRETLLDEGERIVVTQPPGISRFPHNRAMFGWMLFSFLLAGFWIWRYISANTYGFTLIELLIVVVIIGILAALAVV